MALGLSNLEKARLSRLNTSCARLFQRPDSVAHQLLGPAPRFRAKTYTQTPDPAHPEYADHFPAHAAANRNYKKWREDVRKEARTPWPWETVPEWEDI